MPNTCDQLIGVPEASLNRLVARLKGLRIGDRRIVGQIKAFGSRAGSTFRGRGPLPTSDLDIYLDLGMHDMGRRGFARSNKLLGIIADEFEGETGFPVSIHRRKPIDIPISNPVDLW